METPSVALKNCISFNFSYRTNQISNCAFIRYQKGNKYKKHLSIIL